MTRTFLPWSRPLLPQVARHLWDAHVHGEEGRMDRALVVLPGARAGRRLKELLVEEGERRGLRLIPPRVVTPGVLPELLERPAGRRASSALARIAWGEALRSLPPVSLGRVFARLPDRARPLGWTALAGEVERLHHAVVRGAMSFAEVADLIRRDGRREDLLRWEVLAQVQERYEEVLASAGVGDPDLERMRAVKAGRSGWGGAVWLVGITDLPALVRRALDPIGERVHALVHAPSEEAGRFDDLGCVVSEAWSDWTIPFQDERVCLRDRPSDQAEAVAQELAELGGRYAPEEVSIGAPDPHLIPFITQRLTLGGVPVRDAAGRRVSLTGPFRLLSVVADYLDDRRFEAFAALARHPDVGRWIIRRGPGTGTSELALPDGWLEPLDLWYMQHLPSRMIAPLPGEATRAGRVVAALARLLDDDLLSQLKGVRRLSAWTSSVLRLLAEVYPDATSPSSRFGRSAAGRAIEVVRRSVALHRDIPEALDPPCTAGEALRLHLAEVGDLAIPPEADEAAVELLGWLELHLDDAPVAIVAGLNDPWLPQSVSVDSFLPNYLRERLGLEDNALRYARDAYRLTALLHSTERVLLVSGRRSVLGDPVRPSRLLFAADPDEVAARVRRFYDPEGSAVREGSAAPGASSVAKGPAPRGRTSSGDQAESIGGVAPIEVAPVEEGVDGQLSLWRAPESVEVGLPPEPDGFGLPPEPVLRLDPPPTALHVSGLGLLVQDPYRYVLEREMRLAPLEDAAREMDGRLFGTLAHRVLERFGRSDEAASVDESAIRHRLESILDDELDLRFASAPRVAVRIQGDQLRARLLRFAAVQAERARAGWRIVAVECATPPEGVPLDVDGTTVRMHARIDRVDVHDGRGEWAVLDYKTGDQIGDPDVQHRRKGRWVDLQLPLYRWLAGSLLGRDGGAVFPPGSGQGIGVGYFALPRSLDRVGVMMASWTEEEIASALACAQEAARTLLSGSVSFDRARSSGRRPYLDVQLGALLGRGLLVDTAAEEEES